MCCVVAAAVGAGFQGTRRGRQKYMVGWGRRKRRCRGADGACAGVHAEAASRRRRRLNQGSDLPPDTGFTLSPAASLSSPSLINI